VWFASASATLAQFVIANASVVQKVEMGQADGSAVDQLLQLNDAVNAFVARTSQPVPATESLLDPEV
jgi:hypothetical protein